MPPVAHDHETLLLAALRENRGTERPSTWRSLAKALSAHPGSTQKQESWKREINRIREGKRPSEHTVMLMLEVLETEPDHLPKPRKPPTLAQLADYLEGLEVEGAEREEETVAALQAIRDQLVELESRVGRLEVARAHRGTR